MGIRDRKYMGETPSEPDGSVGSFVARLLTVLFAAYLVIFSLRFPLHPFLKLPMLVGLFFFIRYLWRLPQRLERNSFHEQGLAAEKNQHFIKAAYNYERAVALDPTDGPTIVRLLSTFEASGQIIKAKELIATLDGIIIPERHVEEFEHLVADYQLVTLEKARSGSRVRLQTQTQ